MCFLLRSYVQLTRIFLFIFSRKRCDATQVWMLTGDNRRAAHEVREERKTLAHSVFSLCCRHARRGVVHFFPVCLLHISLYLPMREAVRTVDVGLHPFGRNRSEQTLPTSASRVGAGGQAVAMTVPSPGVLWWQMCLKVSRGRCA